MKLKSTSLFLALAALALHLFVWAAHGATFRWANTSNRIYVEGGGSATLTDIKTALPNAPLDQLGNNVWLLRANLQIEDGSTLVLAGTQIGGDVNEFRLQSLNATNAGSFVTIIADWGTLRIQGTRITSWDTTANGPDTEFQTFGRAFLRVRSRLAPDGVTPLESRMDIIDSDISNLGFDASESYGLSWKVVGTHPDPTKIIYDFVKVYGDIRNSRIHHNFWAVYTYGLKDGQWVNNEVDNNSGYGFDLHDDSDNVLIEGNNVHHNGGVARGLHGIIASRRCDRLTIRNNRSWANAGNGIMLHRHCDDCLVENNDSFLNADSGVAIFDSDRNIVRNNLILSNFNAGIRLSVGAADNFLTNNNIGFSGGNGLYYFAGTDPGEPDPVDPTVTVRLRRNTAASNYVHHSIGEAMKIGDSDNNLFIGNRYEANQPEIAVWTSTQIRFVGNTIPTSSVVRLFGLLPNMTTATRTTTTTFEGQPVIRLSMADAFTAATFKDTRGGIYDFDQPAVATLVDSSGASVTVMPSQVGAGTTAVLRNFFATVSGGSAQVNPTLWTVGGDFRKQWTLQSSSASATVRYTVGDLQPGTFFSIQKNGQPFSSLQADANGQVSFADVPGTTSQVQYSVAAGAPPTRPTVTVTATDAAGSETAPNPATFTFSRSGSTAAALAVAYRLSGTASNGVDYSTLSGSLNIPVGSASATLTVTPIDDAAVEGNETVIVTISTNAAYVVGAPSSATATIADNEQSTRPTVSIVASDASGAEVASDSTAFAAPNPATFTFSRSGSTTGALTVGYSIGGTAVNGTDYASLSGTLTIPAGSASTPLRISPFDDATAESSETVVLTVLPNAAYVVGSPSSATATIADNDTSTQTTVSIVASDAGGAEGASNPATFTFSRTGSTAAAMGVKYLVGGTAANGSDYATLSGTITIPAGSLSATLTVSPLEDTSVEGNETVVVSLAAETGYSVGSPSSATVTIADNDQAPPTLPTVKVVATDGSAAERNRGQNRGRFTFTRTGSIAAPLTVQYSVGGTAANGTDYATLSGSVTINAGTASARVDVTPIADELVEGNETVSVTVAANAAYTVGSPASATVTIADDTSSGGGGGGGNSTTVTVVASDASASESGGNAGSFTFSRSGNTAAALTVSYSVGGTAANGTDYASLSGSVTIPAGSASSVVTVSPIDDSVVEGSETVVVTLAANGYTVGSSSSATVTIADNDGVVTAKPAVAVIVTDVLASEAGTDPGTFRISRTGSTAQALTVYYSLGGTASNGTDYQALPGSITIPAGAASADVVVKPVDDTVFEVLELVVLTLTPNASYDVLVGIAALNIFDNDLLFP